MVKVGVIDSIRDIHTKYRLNQGSVSEHTRSAQMITKEWQKSVRSESIQVEVLVSPENNEKIDVVDINTLTAYELKVSGKNSSHEFFKDVMKVLTYNEYHQSEEHITKLVFISEQSGIDSLSKRLDSRLLELIQKKHLLSVNLVGI